MDRRIGAGASTTSNPPPQTSGNTGNNAVAPVASTSAMTNEGKAEYEIAYGKLKAKDYDGAIAGFKSEIAQYPNSEYSGNSHFWLGFIYQTKGDLTTAAKSFSTLIDKFPSHAKTPDAKYNLGKIYYQQGNTAKAKELLKDVASGTSKSAPLAKSYLESL
jgi:tol-pal system protein YbgF